MNEMKILKKGECPSLSGRSTLTYRIGINDKDEIYLSLTGNTGTGLFKKEDWVSLSTFEQLLAKMKNPFTSGQLAALFTGKSANCQGFFLAVLLNEGLLKPSREKQRHFELVDPAEHRMILAAWTEPASKGKPGKKKAKEEVAA